MASESGTSMEDQSCHKYKQRLMCSIKEVFSAYVVPETVEHLFHKYRSDILNSQDMEYIRTTTSRKGKIEGAKAILERIWRYDDWFPCLLKVLRDPSVRLPHVADQLEKIKKDFDTEWKTSGGLTKNTGKELNQLRTDLAKLRKELDECLQQLQIEKDEKEHYIQTSVQEMKEKEQQIQEMAQKITKNDENHRHQMKTITTERDDLKNTIDNYKKILKEENNKKLLLKKEMSNLERQLGFVLEELLQTLPEPSKIHDILQKVVKNEYTHVLSWLVHKNIEIDMDQKIWQEVYFCATRHGLSDIVKKILDVKDPNKIKSGNNKTSILELASGYHNYVKRSVTENKGHEYTMEVLINRGADMNSQDDDGWTALMHCADDSWIKGVKILLDAGADHSLCNKCGQTAMFLVSNEKCLRYLLDKKADVNVVDNASKTPLIYFTTKGWAEGVEILLLAGANVNAQDASGATALFYTMVKSTSMGYIECLKLLLKYGAEINIQDKKQHTALMFSPEHNIKCLEILLQQGADINIKDERCYTVLFYASKKYPQNDECIRLLIKAGVDVNTKFGPDDEVSLRKTALMYCAVNGSSEAIKVLLEAQADINCEDSYGNTALMLAAEAGELSCLQVLLEAGALVNHRNKKGESALDLARRSNKNGPECVQVIKSAIGRARNN